MPVPTAVASFLLAGPPVFVRNNKRMKPYIATTHILGFADILFD